jgi:Zn-dependent protease
VTFRLGSIPVRVHPWFWLTALLLGGNFREPRVVMLWILVAFVSVLVHELGHALAGMAFGLAPQIDLHGMGGTTSWIAGKRLGYGKSIVVSLAGPLAGMALGLAIMLAQARGWSPSNPYVALGAEITRTVNITWGVLNLVPLLPLDGGNVMRSVLHILTRGRGEKPARVVSVVVAVAGLAFALKGQSVWLAFLCGLFALRNVQAFRALGQRGQADQEGAAPSGGAEHEIEGMGGSNEARAAGPEARGAPPVTAPAVESAAVPADPHAATEAAYQALEREDPAAAIRAVQPALAEDAPPAARAAGTKLLAYALLLEGEWQALIDVLERAKAMLGREELERYARTARELGREADALAIERMLAPSGQAT